MKKTLITLAGIALIVTAIYAESTQQKNTGAGLQIGTTSTQKIGFFGATPTNKLTGVTNQVANLATLTLYTMTITNAHADVTNVVTVVTNVTINAVAGPPSTNTINNLIQGLQNYGLFGN